MPDIRLARRSLELNRDRPEDHVNNTAGYEEWSNGRVAEISVVSQGGQNTSVLGLRNEDATGIAGRLISRNEIVNAMYPPATFPNGMGEHAHGAYYDIRYNEASGQEEPYVICHFGGNPSHWHWSYRDGEDILPIMEEGHVHGPLMIFNERGEPDRKLRFAELRKPFEELIKRKGLDVSIDELMARFPTSPDQRSTPMDPVENKEPTTEERLAALEAQNQRNEAILNLPKDHQDHVRGLADDAAKDAFLARSAEEQKDEVARANIDPSQRVEFTVRGQTLNSIDNPEAYLSHLETQELRSEVSSLREENETNRAAEEVKSIYRFCVTTENLSVMTKAHRLLSTGLTAEEYGVFQTSMRSQKAVANNPNIRLIQTDTEVDDESNELGAAGRSVAEVKEGTRKDVDNLAEQLRSEDAWKEKSMDERRLEIYRRRPDLRKQSQTGKVAA